ncbi:acyl carrier protein [Clostridium sp.]|uniref:acyl carrier protein n=1 Tax=Clostridium sp. TaxID=1506 RepID=UPI00283DB0EB|nr:acyl carrier protein [Clostridium sp.]MDR3598827.1 acyl carrier protein [Clostridium sp.]
MDHLNELKEFVIKNFMFGQKDSLENDTDFFNKGIIDSTGTLELVSFIEETYNISVLDNELIKENFSFYANSLKFSKHGKIAEYN